MNLIELNNITMSFGQRIVLEDFNLTVGENELIGITGPSGSGKSTILNIMGLLLEPTSGQRVHFGEENVKVNSRKALKMLRHEIGYLFQNYALIDDETVEKNLLYALRYSKSKDKRKEIETALEKVGLSGMLDQKVFTLSGGEQQRLAVARLLVKPCRVILADEPTGNLDDDNQGVIVELFERLVELGKTVVVVTHEKALLPYFDRVIELQHTTRIK